MDEYFAIYGEPSDCDMQEAHDDLAAAGFFTPETDEERAKRLAALARLWGSGPRPEKGEECRAG